MDIFPRPRGRRRAVLVALAAASLLLGCARSKSWIERRKDTFVQIAALINEPIRELQPYHWRIMPSGSSVMLLDAQLDACFEAAPRIEAIERAPLPPDHQGKPIESVESLTRAAESFRTGLSACRAKEAKKANSPAPSGPEERPADADRGATVADRGATMAECLLRCMKDWSQITRSVEHVRRDADWVGVRVESILKWTKVGNEPAAQD